MTREEKREWLKSEGNAYLLKMLVSLNEKNSYGKYTDDIELVTNEILRRMEGRA